MLDILLTYFVRNHNLTTKPAFNELNVSKPNLNTKLAFVGVNLSLFPICRWTERRRTTSRTNRRPSTSATRPPTPRTRPKAGRRTWWASFSPRPPSRGMLENCRLNKKNLTSGKNEFLEYQKFFSPFYRTYFTE